MKLTVFLFAVTTAIFFSSCSKNEQISTQTNHNHSGMVAMQESFDFTVTYCDEGEDEDPQPMLSGGVTDSVGNDLYRACVEIQTTGGSTVSIIGTDSSGHYFFNSVSNGSYNLKVSYPGFTPKITPFTVSGTPQTINVVLD